MAKCCWPLSITHLLHLLRTSSSHTNLVCCIDEIFRREAFTSSVYRLHWNNNETAVVDIFAFYGSYTVWTATPWTKSERVLICANSSNIFMSFCSFQRLQGRPLLKRKGLIAILTKETVKCSVFFKKVQSILFKRSSSVECHFNLTIFGDVHVIFSDSNRAPMKWAIAFLVGILVFSARSLQIACMHQLFK